MSKKYSISENGKDAGVKWLATFSYCAENRRKVVSSLSDDLKTLIVKPAVNGYIFRIRGRIRQRKEMDGLRLSYAVFKIQ